jgi:hypothetical protein
MMALVVLISPSGAFHLSFQSGSGYFVALRIFSAACGVRCILA